MISILPPWGSWNCSQRKPACRFVAAVDELGPEHVRSAGERAASASHVANATWSSFDDVDRKVVHATAGVRGLRTLAAVETPVAPARCTLGIALLALRLGRRSASAGTRPGAGPRDRTAPVRDLRRFRRVRSAPDGRHRDPRDVVRQAESKLRRSAEELHRRMEELAEVFVGDRETRRAAGTSSTRGVGRRRRRRPRPSAVRRRLD